MKKTSINKTKNIAICALLSALSFVALYLGTLSGVFDLCAVVISAVCIAYAQIEMGSAYPWGVCAVTFILALLLLPNRLVAFEYLFLGGAFPIVKAYAERLGIKKGKAVTWIVKLAYYNVGLLAVTLLAKFVFVLGNEFETFGLSPAVITVLVFVFGNAFLIFYDFAMTRMIAYYLNVLRKKLKIRHSH